MRPLALALWLGMALLTPAQAQNEVYVCTDAQGAREYRNTGITVGCKKLAMPGLAVLTTPEAAPKLPPKKVAMGRDAAAGVAGNKPDAERQQARDSERRLLLQDELKAEERKLASLRVDFNNGEPERRGDERNYAKYQERVAAMQGDMARFERNIAALRREIGTVR